MGLLDSEKLKQGLMEDYSQAQARMGDSILSKPREDSDFAPRALRIQNKAVGEAELGRLEKAMNRTSNDLVFQSGMVDELEQSKFKMDFQKKMNQLKLHLLRSAGEVKKYIASKKLDQEQEQAIWGALSSVASGASQSLVGGIGSSSSPTNFNLGGNNGNLNLGVSGEGQFIKPVKFDISGGR